uniref:Uncharacterized protein n=1 Tax=Cercocebus atys TaxID=9531 RepID=A0A2K5P1U9_CERAT
PDWPRCPLPVAFLSRWLQSFTDGLFCTGGLLRPGRCEFAGAAFQAPHAPAFLRARGEPQDPLSHPRVPAISTSCRVWKHLPIHSSPTPCLTPLWKLQARWLLPQLVYLQGWDSYSLLRLAALISMVLLFREFLYPAKMSVSEVCSSGLSSPLLGQHKTNRIFYVSGGICSASGKSGFNWPLPFLKTFFNNFLCSLSWLPCTYYLI